MKVPVEWISECIDIKSSIEELSDRLTMAGLEVEEINQMSAQDVAAAGGSADDRDDRVLAVKVTPNRGDWLSMLGVAREAAAITGWDIRMPEPEPSFTGPDLNSLAKVDIAAPDLCNRYVAMVVRNIKIKESPDWLKNRLIRAGMRPINNIVDITNYVMLEFGQPLHAFDYDLLAGHEIIVRRAKDGEVITSLDGVERNLEPEMLVIADHDRAMAIAGVMGGADSEVTSETKNILIESANFDAVSVRRTSKRLGLVTESSYRFERGVDPSVTELAAKRAAELMCELADGEVASGIIDVFPGKMEPRTIEVRPERVNSILGANLSIENMISHLQALQFSVMLCERLVVTVPSFRPDVVKEIDVIEEIARIHGYENIGETLPASSGRGRDSALGQFVQRLRGILMACGMQEVLTHSVIDPTSIEITGLESESLAVRNPFSEDVSRLRTMLSPNLLQVVARNQSVGTKDINVFEIGKVYRRSSNGDPFEFISAAGAMIGSQWSDSWNLSKDALNADFYLMKGALESLLGRLDVENVVISRFEHPLLHPTRTAKVEVDGVLVGMLGEVSPMVSERLGLRGRPCLFEIDVEKLIKLVPLAVGYVAPAKYPALHRHISVVLKKDAVYAEIQKTIMDSGSSLIEDVDLLDIYTGPQAGDDEQNMTLSLVFRSVERTLTDDEVNRVLDLIKSGLVESFGAIFRG